MSQEAQRAQIQSIISDLAHMEPFANQTNHFADNGSPGNTIRRANLQCSLEDALQDPPDLLIIGEAPGYRGSRRSGVAFVDERMLVEGINGRYGSARGYIAPQEDGKILREQTATFVWRAMIENGLSMFGWSACPFHPYLPGQPLNTNRRPLRAEVLAGHEIVMRLHQLLPNAYVIAMGEIGDRALTELAIPHTRVRHPAQGGAPQFLAGMREVKNMLR